MVGNAEIRVASRLGRLRHGFDRIGTVRKVGMRVKDTADIGRSDEFPRTFRQSASDLATSFSKFGRDKGKSKRAVDRLFAGGRNRLAAFVQAGLAERKPFGGRERL